MTIGPYKKGPELEAIMKKTNDQDDEKKKARRNRKRLCIGIACSLAIGFAIGLNWDKLEPEVKKISSKAFSKGKACSAKALDKGKKILEEKKVADKVDNLKDYADKLLVLSEAYTDKAKDILKQIKDM